METWMWIALVAVLVVAALLVLGLTLAKRRRVSITAPTTEKPAVTTGTSEPPAKGGYRTGSSISFSAGAGTATAPKPPAEAAAPADKSLPEPREAAPAEHPVAERTELDGEPGVGDDAAVPRDSVTRDVIDVALPDTDAPATATAEPAEVTDAPAEVTDAPTAVTDAPAEVTDEPAAQAPAEAPADGMREDVPAVEEPITGPKAPTVAVPEADAPVVETPSVETPSVETPSVETPVADEDSADVIDTADVPISEGSVAEDAAPPAAVVDEVPVDAPPAVQVPVGHTPEVAPDSEIAPSAGRLSKLRGRLARSQNAFGRSLLGLLGAGSLDEDSWTDVEDTLLLADLGSAAALEITEKLRAEVAAHGVADAAAAKALLRRVLIDAVGPDMDRSVRALPHDGRPSVVLVVGVNGTGKTTTTGKLARVLVADGRHVVLGAADTFRAAAADQLATWAERAGAHVVRAEAGADPAAVAFDAVKYGIEESADAVLIDTAGRLHTKTGLMDELGKVKRVVEKQATVDEVLLVLDATTGQNGLVQARVFAEVVDVSGIVLTKLDGTAKGGIVVAVQRALGVPVKLVGLGEGADDLAPFEPEAFIDALLGD